MLTIMDTQVFGWEAAIRGMRNPMNSWEKIDSYVPTFCEDCLANKRGDGVCSICPGDNVHLRSELMIGQNDLSLMKKLVKAGPDHRKFMRMIVVYVDIIAPFYWWKEFDTYKIGTVANSCSTMHKLTDEEFILDDFSHDKLLPGALITLEHVIERLNFWRDEYLRTGSKEVWYQMIQLLPSSYNQRRTVQMNYEVLHNIYHARKAHKLDEWREKMCEWIKTLPYSELITEEGI